MMQYRELPDPFRGFLAKIPLVSSLEENITTTPFISRFHIHRSVSQRWGGINPVKRDIRT